MAGPREDRVEIGYVARAHGIRGELRVVTHDPESTTLSSAPSVCIGDASYRVRKARSVDGGFLVTLEGVADRNQAERLKGKPVLVDRELVASEDEVLLSELVGCQLVLDSGEVWGQVAAIESSPYQDRLVVHHDGVERLLPVVDAFILDIDLDTATIVVDPPEGLPEEPIRDPGKPA
jgi:16S rRNA processing protein RimM